MTQRDYSAGRSEENTLRQYVLFPIRGEAFAAPLQGVFAFVEASPFQRVKSSSDKVASATSLELGRKEANQTRLAPEAPVWALGIADYQDVEMVVVDLAFLVGLGPVHKPPEINKALLKNANNAKNARTAQHEKCRWIIARYDDLTVAFVIDGLFGIKYFDPSSLEVSLDFEGFEARRFFVGSFEFDDSPLMVFDVPALFTEHQKNMLRTLLLNRRKKRLPRTA